MATLKRWNGTSWDPVGGPQGLPGPKGDPGTPGTPGSPGSPGAAATISISSVSTLTPGASATVTNAGTANAAALVFGIPAGLKGDKGDTGNPGSAGTNGWTPAFAVVTDGTRRVLQVSDWTGGTGTKPATGQYVGATGLTSTLASAIDIRGATGSQGPAGGATVVAATTALTAVDTNIVLGNGTFNVTLPAATANRQLSIKNIGTGVVTVVAPNPALIDGASTAPLSRRYQSITVVADGTNWHII